MPKLQAAVRVNSAPCGRAGQGRRGRHHGKAEVSLLNVPPSPEEKPLGPESPLGCCISPSPGEFSKGQNLSTQRDLVPSLSESPVSFTCPGNVPGKLKGRGGQGHHSGEGVNRCDCPREVGGAPALSRVSDPGPWYLLSGVGSVTIHTEEPVTVAALGALICIAQP